MKMNSVGSLWQSAWKLYTDRFAIITQIIIIPVVVLGLGNILKAIGGLSFSIAGSILLAAGVLLSIVANAAIIHLFEHSSGLEESYVAAGRLFWRLIWLGILIIFALFGGFAMLVVPGVLLMVGFVFANYALILEGKHGFEALTTSREYVKGYWWSVFGRLLLLLLGFVVAYIVIGLPFASIGGKIGGALASTIITLFIAPFSIAYYYTMYRNLVSLKPQVHDGTVKSSKTFIIVAQAVAAFIVLIAVLGIIFAVILGRGTDRASGSVNYYGGYGTQQAP